MNEDFLLLTTAKLWRAQRWRDPERGEDFYEYIDGVGFDHFKAKETLQLRRLKVTAPVPPRRLWRNILPTLVLVDALREYVGVPVIVGNGYRNRELNRRARGSMFSTHIWFRAIDADCDDPLSWEVFREGAAALYIHVGELCKMGLGVYGPNGSRLHIDTGRKQRHWNAPHSTNLLRKVST